MIQLTILYIWFGFAIPQQYLLQMSNLTYPIEILINPITKLSMPGLNIEKSYKYRLEILKNGGLYSDFDNTINYQCLMKNIENFQGEMLVMEHLNQRFKDIVPMSLIYVPTSNTSLVKEILTNQNDKNCKDSIIDCYGPETLQKYRSRITIKNLSSCVVHGFDWSWWNDSNKLLQKNFQPFPQLKQKKIKKKKYFQDLLNIKWSKKHYQRQIKLQLSEMEQCAAKISKLQKSISDNKQQIQNIQQKQQNIFIINISILTALILLFCIRKDIYRLIGNYNKLQGEQSHSLNC